MTRMLIDVPDPGDLLVAADELDARADTLSRAVDQASAALARTKADTRTQGAEILRVAGRKQRIRDVAAALRAAAVYVDPTPPVSRVVLPGDVDFVTVAAAHARAKDVALPGGHDVEITHVRPPIDLSSAAVAWGAMNRDQLRELCKDSSLSSAGKKADLVARLVDHLRVKYEQAPPEHAADVVASLTPAMPDTRPIPAADRLGTPVDSRMAETLANLRAHPDAAVPLGRTADDDAADPDLDGLTADPFDDGGE